MADGNDGDRSGVLDEYKQPMLPVEEVPTGATWLEKSNLANAQLCKFSAMVPKSGYACRPRMIHGVPNAKSALEQA